MTDFGEDAPAWPYAGGAEGFFDALGIEGWETASIQLWSGHSAVYGAEDTLVVGPDQVLVLDDNADLGTVIVDGGHLVVADMSDITLSADRVLVLDGGTFQVGSEDHLHTHQFTLELTGDDPGFDLDISDWLDHPGMTRQITDNDAYLMAMGDGSAIEIHAADVEKESWSQLRQTAEAGAQSIKLTERSGWQVGDIIAIASSGFDHSETEERTVTAVAEDGRKIWLDRPLEHRHYGAVETYDNGLSGEDAREWSVDMRAEVALLSRNVTITGDEDAHLDHIGGHIMVMMGAEMRIEGAEITRMGQEGVLGRYGAHWHLSGDATGDYLRHNSFHEIYNKGITLHGVQNAVVHDNVIYGTIGHGVFTEDATEFGNRITDNLGFGTQAADPSNALTTADIDHVSTFWIENPNNTVTGNHAAGSDFAGFWYAPSRPHGQSAATGTYDDLSPQDDPISAFTGNTAHSNQINLGIEGRVIERPGEKPTFKQARYEAEDPWEIQDFTAYKSSDRAIWTRTLGGTFSDLKLADNTRATFFSYTSTLEDSVIIGRSQGNASDDPKLSHRGHSIYDGPSGIERVHFANFNGADQAIQVNGAGEKSTTHFASGITFGAVAEANKIDFGSNPGGANFDYVWATSLIDLDGSVSGIEGATITAMIQETEPGMENAQNAGTRISVAEDAQARPDWSAWINPTGEIGWLRIKPSHDNPDDLPFSDPSVNTTRYDITRSDGETMHAARPTWDTFVNASVLADADYSYAVRLHEVPAELDIAFKGFSEQTRFEYAFENLPSNAIVTGAAEVANAAELASVTQTSFYRNGTTLVFMIVAEDQNYLTPTTDDATMKARTFGADFKIKTGDGNDAPNTLMDFETGPDPRGGLTSQAVTTSEVRKRWGDSDDAAIMWQVTADGDGQLGHADYHLSLGSAQNWLSFKSLQLDTLLRGEKAGVEVIVTDQDEGDITLGHLHGGTVNLDLRDVDAAYLDQVTGLTLRVHESDLTDDAEAAGPTTKVFVRGAFLSVEDAPRFDFQADELPLVSKLSGNGAGVGWGSSFPSQAASSGLVWDIVANQDNRQGYGALKIKLNNDDWRGRDWLTIDAGLAGDAARYVVFLRDASDGFHKLGEGQSGAVTLNLGAVDDRYLDDLDSLVIRVREEDLAEGSAGSATFNLRSIDLSDGPVTLANFDDGVDPRGNLSATHVDSVGIRANQQGGGQNWWQLLANGDGIHGHLEYSLTIDPLDLRAFGALRLSGDLTGRPVHPEIFLRDQNDGLIRLGRFDQISGDIDLAHLPPSALDQVDQFVFRLHEDDVQPDPDRDAGAARMLLSEIALIARPGSDVLTPLI